MTRLATIELFQDKLSFSAGHFTILSATERERLHGHNYQVYCALTTIVKNNGMTFDYRHYKEKLHQLCRQLNQIFLIPGNSSHLKIEEKDDDYYYIHFHQEKIPFLKTDILVLPVENITVEELSYWFLTHLTQDKEDMEKNAIQKIEVKIASAPGRCGSSVWEKIK